MPPAKSKHARLAREIFRADPERDPEQRPNVDPAQRAPSEGRGSPTGN